MVLITGGTGFVGAGIVQYLAKGACDCSVKVAVRRLDKNWPSAIAPVLVADINSKTDWSDALNGVGIVVHCAARVHVMKDESTDKLNAYREVNVGGTIGLAKQAAAVGVRRFIFVSSIKVNGEETKSGEIYTADDIPAPLDPYGVSKMEAEQALRELSAQTGMELVIIRPPLIYGPGVKANFASMMRWVDLGVPLPLGGIHNARSMVSLDNLVDLISCCLHHPAAAGQIFLVSDGKDISIVDLLRHVAKSLGKKVILISVPRLMLLLLATVFGKRKELSRLSGSLQIDIMKNYTLLGWRPPFTLEQGLRKTVEGLRK
jgi:nucleoside-diphosphate-sugar epimerase